MIQEGITNAIKHAPGAAVAITVRGKADGVEIRVVNGPPLAGSSGLERAGGGNGISGMRERVVQCGGTFTANQTAEGGWELVGLLPHHASAPLSHSEGGPSHG